MKKLLINFMPNQQVTYMIQLNLIFILLLFATLARYLVFDAFDPVMFALIFSFPIASIGIYIMSKKFAEKERSYQPKDIPEWSFSNKQTSLLNEKPLFKGEERRGYVKRYFTKRGRYVFADIFGSSWYLSLEIQIDQDVYDVRCDREKWLTQQDRWIITKNGEQIGEAHTRINLKNMTKLKEAIEFTFQDTSYLSSASTITSTISLTQDEELLGTMKRNHIISTVQVIDVKEDQPEYIIALIVHSFYFKNK